MGITQKIRRTLRPAGKTAQAILRWKRFSFNDAPPVFGNSKPKSGSHLLLQILNGLTQIMPYKYVDAEPIRTIRKEGGRRTADEILRDLRVVPNGVIAGSSTRRDESFAQHRFVPLGFLIPAHHQSAG